jgi:hypothetical protein
VLNEFVLPDFGFAAPRRAQTTTPLQALTLLNHRFTLDLTAALAAQLTGSTAENITTAYARVLQRTPSNAERTAAADLIAQHGLTAFCRALLNSNELMFLP